MVDTKEPQKQLKVIGTRPLRHDGWDKVTGRAVYSADVKLPGLVHGAVLRSPHAHARILKIDTSKAEAAPGVLAVITGADFPILMDRFIPQGEGVTNVKYISFNVMAQDKANYKGHPVAAVAAVDQNAAAEAAKLIDVTYEVLEPVRSVDEAMASGAQIIHPDLVGDDLGEKATGTNVEKHYRHELGDVEAGFKAATTVL